MPSQYFAGTDYLLSLPIVMLTVFALGILLIDLMIPPEWKWTNAVTAFMGVLFSAAGVLKIQYAQFEAAKVGRSLEFAFVHAMVLDHFAIYFYYLFLAGAGLSILMSIRYLEIEHENHGEFYALILFFRRGHDVHGLGFRYRTYFHWPGVDGDLDLRAGWIPAPRSPLQ